MTEGRCNFGDFVGRHPEPFKENFPLAHGFPDIGNQLCSLGFRQGEHGVRGERVVQRCEPALWADPQVQEALGRMARARQSSGLGAPERREVLPFGDLNGYSTISFISGQRLGEYSSCQIPPAQTIQIRGAYRNCLNCSL